MNFHSKKHAVVLINLGGPTCLTEVKPFLKNLFSDPDIFQFPFGKFGQALFSSLMAQFRSPRSRQYYTAIGGGSPLQENTLAQSRRLQEALSTEGDFRVFTAQRYWRPFIHEAVVKIQAESFDDVTLVPLFPQYSTTTTLSVLNEWKRRDRDLSPHVIDRFYDNAGFVQASVDRIQETLKNFQVPPHILFSAHSIPQSRVTAGDPYVGEVEKTVDFIMQRLGGKFEHSLCFQSRVGLIQWVGPDIADHLKELRKKNVRHVLLYPVSFVSEHVETLYELDQKYHRYALSLGFDQYERAMTVQASPIFIQGLKERILQELQ